MAFSFHTIELLTYVKIVAFFGLLIFLIILRSKQRILQFNNYEHQLLHQAKKLTFATDITINHQQWSNNIENSGLLHSLFGNLGSMHGKIKPTWVRGTLQKMDYEIEFFRFHILTPAIKLMTKYTTLTNTTETNIEKIGPFVGLHINLKNKYPEVDILHKNSHPLAKTLDLALGKTAIKNKQWETESTEFNKNYVILSENHLFNLTVLTPDVMGDVIDSQLKLNIELIDNHLLLYTEKKLTKGNELETMLNIALKITENLE